MGSQQSNLANQPTQAKDEVENHEAESADSQESRLWREILSNVHAILWLVFFYFLIKGTLVEAYKIPSSSMEPTLTIGDHILVSKLSYGFRLPFVGDTVWQYSSPERGDVVVFAKRDLPFTQEDDSGINIIKRVIGIGGDIVEVRGTTVIINGKKLQEDDNFRLYSGGGIKNFGPQLVPEGHVFLLGDNRDQSRDSRFWEEGPFLEVSRVKGQAFMIYWNKSLQFERIFNIIQ